MFKDIEDLDPPQMIIKGIIKRIIWVILLFYIFNSIKSNANVHNDVTSNIRMVLRAQRPISEGEEVCISYIPIMQGKMNDFGIVTFSNK